MRCHILFLIQGCCQPYGRGGSFSQKVDLFCHFPPFLLFHFDVCTHSSVYVNAPLFIKMVKRVIGGPLSIQLLIKNNYFFLIKGQFITFYFQVSINTLTNKHVLTCSRPGPFYTWILMTLVYAKVNHFMDVSSGWKLVSSEVGYQYLYLILIKKAIYYSTLKNIMNYKVNKW